MKPSEIPGFPIGELKRQLLESPVGWTLSLLEAMEADDRIGVRRLGSTLRRRRLADRRERQRLDRLSRFETELWSNGVCRVAGVDEAGVGPIAGPLVAAAVILPPGFRLTGLDDSKKILDEAKRETLGGLVRDKAVSWAVGLAVVDEIDRLNVYRAGLLAMQRAVDGLTVKPEHLLVDARTLPGCSIPQQAIVHGDALSATIAAASLVAKTTRDSIMREFDRAHPGYGFASHKGYPTQEHLAALKTLGVLPIHRKSYSPVREALGDSPVQTSLFDS
jgi:ribonuclease HII